MTGDSDFWEILVDKLPYSRLDFPSVSIKCTVPALPYCLPLVFIPICFLAFLRPRKKGHTYTRAALKALLTVVVPTCSLWPSRYIELARVLRSRIDIPLEMIVEDTIDGVIELCNPVNDLAELVGSGVIVNGHTIRLHIGWKWWINYFQWRMLAKSKSGFMLGQSNWFHGNTAAVNSSPLGLSLSPFASTLSTSNHLLCLDTLPHGIIPSFNAGCKVTLEFTAFSPSLRIFSTAQIISAIPFIISERSHRRPRSLVSVLKQLSASYDPDLVVDSLSNVSADYEHALRHVYKSCSGEKIRGMGMENLGIKAWRLDLFLVALEAALVRRGWIVRWAVQVTAQ